MGSSESREARPREVKGEPSPSCPQGFSLLAEPYTHQLSRLSLTALQ